MSVQITGIEQLNRDIARIKKNIGNSLFKAIYEGGKLVETTAKRKIRTISYGKTVTRTREGGGTYKHIASPAGSAPNTDTGRLINSVTTEIGADSVLVGSSVNYAGTLEFGTTEMKPRPWLNPSFEENRNKIRNKMEFALMKSFKK